MPSSAAARIQRCFGVSERSPDGSRWSFQFPTWSAAPIARCSMSAFGIEHHSMGFHSFGLPLQTGRRREASTQSRCASSRQAHRSGSSHLISFRTGPAERPLNHRYRMFCRCSCTATRCVFVSLGISVLGRTRQPGERSRSCITPRARYDVTSICEMAHTQLGESGLGQALRPCSPKMGFSLPSEPQHGSARHLRCPHIAAAQTSRSPSIVSTCGRNTPSARPG